MRVLASLLIAASYSIRVFRSRQEQAIVELALRQQLAVYSQRRSRSLFDDWEKDIQQLFPGVVEKAHWRHRSFGPATIIETPGNVGRNLLDVQAEGVDGLYLIGERTRAAKVMGVYGSAQVALEACRLIVDR